MKKNKIDKIFDKMDVDQALNTAKLQKAKFNLKEKEVYKQITELNREAKSEKKIMFSGLIINLIIIIGLIASSSIICLAGIKVYKSHSFAFIVSMLFVELVLFQSYYNATIIKQKFYRHYSKLKIMQMGLLIVLIYYNFSFFYSYVKQDKLLVIVTFILCFLVEFCIMNLASLARDLRMLNYTYSDSIEENTGLLKMIIFNLLFKTRKNALKQYRKNLAEYKKLNSGKETFDQDSEDEEEKVFVFESRSKETEPKNLIADSEEIKQIESAEAKEKLFEKKVLNLDNLKIVFVYIIENLSNGNVAPGMGKISKNTEIKTGEVVRIRKKLIEKGYLKTNGSETEVLKQELNLEDFEGEVINNE